MRIPLLSETGDTFLPAVFFAAVLFVDEDGLVFLFFADEDFPAVFFFADVFAAAEVFFLLAPANPLASFIVIAGQSHPGTCNPDL